MNHLSRYLGLTLILAASFAPSSQDKKPGLPASFPDGPERTLVEKTCLTACHGPENVLKKRRTHEGWDNVMIDMAGKGAKATDEQLDTIQEYLTHYYGLVNVNEGTAKEIADILDVTPAEAGIIVKYRETNGAFKSVDDVEKVPGLDEKKIHDRKPRILIK